MRTTQDKSCACLLGAIVLKRASFWVIVLALCVIGPFCDVLTAQNYLTSTGVSGFSAPYPAEMGTVDASSGNLHLEIPLGSFPQRGGGTLAPKLIYDSHIWTFPTDGVSKVWTTQGQLYGLAFDTWGFNEGGATGGYVVSPAGNNGCSADWMLWGESGAQHYFNIPGTWNGSECTGGTSYAVDSSGFRITQTPWNNSGLDAIVTIYAPDGTEVFAGYPSYIAAEDPNGNYLGLTSVNLYPPGIYNPVIDTLGRKIAAPIAESNPMTLQVPNSQGGTSDYVITTATIPVSTAFGQSGVTECNNNCTITVISSIGLPDGTNYSFKYDCEIGTNPLCTTPADQSGYYGTLAEMILPSGGSVFYSYSNFTDAKGSVGRWLTSKLSNGGFWQYTPSVTGGSTQNVTVVRPDYSQDVISFTVNNGSWPTQILSYDTDGATVLSTVKNTWDFSVGCTLILCGGSGAQDVRKLSTSTTLSIPAGTVTKQTKYTYDTPQTGNVTGIEEWKYQSGTSPTFPSVPDRGTYKTYATIGSNNNVNRPTSITVCNNVGTSSSCTGGGTPVAQTKITYDGYGSNGSLALQSVTGAFNHDDTNFGLAYTARGNATQISKLVSGSTYLTTALSYDTTGQVVKVVDSNSNATTFSYADVFYDDNGADPPAAHSGAPKTNAYVTTVTDAIGSTSMGYYYWSGNPALSTDYNSVTTYEHYVDPFDRPTKTDYPIGWALNVYGVPSGSQTEIDSYVAVGDTGSTGSESCTLCTHTQALLDGLGRAATGNLVNNPAGEITVQSVYDGLNRVNSSSHPYIGTSDPNNVYENAYFDGLDRSIATKHPDGEVARLAYGAKITNLGGLTSQQSSAATYGYGFPVISMDESGKQRQEWVDGFGHVIEVDEPSSSTSTRATATITVTGSEGYTEKCSPITCICHTIYDVGVLTINVNGFAASATWDKGATAASMASTLTSALNSFESPVTATLSGTTITMIAGGPGTDPISFSESYPDPGTKDFAFTPTTGTLSGGSGGILVSPYITTYTYDVLGNLTGVTQGSQSRSYQYDGLSRLTQEITPEAGKVTLSYGTPGALCSGDPAKPCSRTAPAPNQTGTSTVTTTYTYNTANKLKQKTHSDTTGTETYTYGTSPSGFNVGRLIMMTDPSGSEAYTYDKIGRVTQVSKTVGSTVYTTSYGYNSGSQLTSIGYPSGRVVYYNYDAVGHLCQVATSASSSCNAAASYLTLPSSSYDAAERPLSATYGNGVVATAAYSPQTFELTNLGYAKGTTTLLGLNYYYQQNSTYCPTGNVGGNDGQIQCIADVSSGTGDSGRSVAYTYDSLGRLLTAKTTGSTQYPAWGLSWTYDRYGNRTNQTVTAGSGYTSSLTINPVNNQVTSPAFTYDASGNVIAEPSPLSMTSTYDGEECNTGYTGNGNTAIYTCDGNQMRVKKAVTGTNAVTTVSIRSGGQVIAEYDNGAGVTSPTREYLYGTNLLAIVTGSTGGSGGTIVYQQRDTLSPRLYTDVNGNDVGEQGTYPFGESWYNNTTTSNWVFTSYERDAESGNDYALARSYANGQGRFLAPDPLEGVVGDPQSWNRYAYVENDPINLSDPSGQGFWSDLFGAIAEIFADVMVAIFAPEALPEVMEVEEDADAGFTVTLASGEVLKLAWSAWGAARSAAYNGEHVHQLANGQWVPDGPGVGEGSAPAPASAPQGGGGPGAGTTDVGSTGASGTGPSGGGATSTASASSPTPGGGGTISNPSGGGIWNECDSCWGAVSWFGNLSAGAADFITWGATTRFNQWRGTEQFVNERSGAYIGGEVLGAGITAAGGTLAAGKVFAGVETKIAIHGAHHLFPLVGEVPHLQVMWWIRGAAGSGGVIRIALTPWWP
jgi:RHS repeat-associated protein